MAGHKWSRSELSDLHDEIKNWLSESRRKGDDDPVIAAAEKVLRARLEGRPKPRDVNIPGLIESLDIFRDGKMDPLGRWISDIMEAVKSIS